MSSIRGFKNTLYTRNRNSEFIRALKGFSEFLMVLLDCSTYSKDFFYRGHFRTLLGFYFVHLHPVHLTVLDNGIPLALPYVDLAFAKAAPGNPSWRQTTMASLISHSGSHVLNHPRSPRYISTRPMLGDGPSASRRSEKKAMQIPAKMYE